MITIFSQSFAHLVGLLPTINVPAITVPSVIIDIVNALWYFLPMKTIGGIAALGAIITGLRFAFALVVRLKSFIPFSGGA